MDNVTRPDYAPDGATVTDSGQTLLDGPGALVALILSRGYQFPRRLRWLRSLSLRQQAPPAPLHTPRYNESGMRAAQLHGHGHVQDVYFLFWPTRTRSWARNEFRMTNRWPYLRTTRANPAPRVRRASQNE